MLSKMVHLWLLYRVRFEKSDENHPGGFLPDHVETKNFDPWRADLAIESTYDVHEA